VRKGESYEKEHDMVDVVKRRVHLLLKRHGDSGATPSIGCGGDDFVARPQYDPARNHL
jgi:hypothetical protein